jgi:hypothetical protein
MKYFAVALLLFVGLTLAGCGSNSNSGNINGTWNATLIDSTNATIFSFGTSLMVNGDGSLAISNFKFTSNSPCLATASSESGSFTLSGNFNGSVKGSFGFNVQSATPAGATLALNGTANGNTITGTWTLTGAGCSGTGSFTMTKM